MIFLAEFDVLKPPFLAIKNEIENAAAMKCLLLMTKFGDIPNGKDNVPFQFSIIMSAIFNGNEPALLDSF